MQTRNCCNTPDGILWLRTLTAEYWFSWFAFALTLVSYVGCYGQSMITYVWTDV